MRTEESNRFHTAHPAARKSLQAMLGAIDKQLAALDADIDQYMRQHFKEVRTWLQSAAGVGEVTSATLVALLGELGRLPRRAIAKLAGVAPLAHDSGPRHATRAIWGGGAEVRAVLYMATVSAIAHNAVIRQFHQHPIARGKPPKLAIVACMRKLLTILRWSAITHPGTTPNTSNPLDSRHSCSRGSG